MKLIYSAGSPYARKARVSVIEAGLADTIETEAIDPWSNPEGYRDTNPAGKVPALIRGEGPALFQSNIICDYLDSLNQGAKLFPAPGPARWTALRQLALADAIHDASVEARVEMAFHQGEMLSQKFIDRQELTVARTLDALEAEADELSGAVTIGQIGVGCALGYRDFRFADNDWRSAHPKLAAWFAEFAQRDSMRKTHPDA